MKKIRKKIYQKTIRITNVLIIEYIKYAKEKGCQMTGTEDINIEHLNVLA